MRTISLVVKDESFKCKLVSWSVFRKFARDRRRRNKLLYLSLHLAFILKMEMDFPKHYYYYIRRIKIHLLLLASFSNRHDVVQTRNMQICIWFISRKTFKMFFVKWLMHSKIFLRMWDKGLFSSSFSISPLSFSLFSYLTT